MTTIIVPYSTCILTRNCSFSEGGHLQASDKWTPTHGVPQGPHSGRDLERVEAVRNDGRPRLWGKVCLRQNRSQVENQEKSNVL